MFNTDQPDTSNDFRLPDKLSDPPPLVQSMAVQNTGLTPYRSLSCSVVAAHDTSSVLCKRVQSTGDVAVTGSCAPVPVPSCSTAQLFMPKSPVPEEQDSADDSVRAQQQQLTSKLESVLARARAAHPPAPVPVQTDTAVDAEEGADTSSMAAVVVRLPPSRVSPNKVTWHHSHTAIEQPLRAHDDVTVNVTMGNTTNSSVTDTVLVARSEASECVTALNTGTGTGTEEKTTEPAPDEASVVRVVVTAVPDALKAQLHELVLTLGWTLVTAIHEPFTHLVVGELSRNEKFLTSVANGRWIVHPSYVFDCAQQNCTLDADAYEWGNTALPAMQNLTEPKCLQLATACRHWRQQVQQTGHRAFHGWSALIWADAARFESFSRLLLGAGARKAQSGLVTTDYSGTTHVFVAAKMAHKITKEVLSGLMDCGSVVYEMQYIAAYLAGGGQCNAPDFYLSEYAKALK